MVCVVCVMDMLVIGYWLLVIVCFRSGDYFGYEFMCMVVIMCFMCTACRPVFLPHRSTSQPVNLTFAMRFGTNAIGKQ